VDAASGWWTAAPTSGQEPWRAGRRPTAEDWRRWLSGLHPDWWGEDALGAALTDALRDLASRSSKLRDLVPWVELAPDLGDYALTPLWESGMGSDPAIGMLLRSLWWGTQAALRLDPGAATRFRCLNATAHLADWLSCHESPGSVQEVWDAVSTADPHRLAAARWYFRQGWDEACRRVLDLSDAPSDPELAVERARLLAQVDEKTGLSKDGGRAGASGDASTP
jgi:hypothetical protein